MKKFVSLILLFVTLCIALAGCAGNDTTNDVSATDATLPRLITDNG